jgi:hypothetical protein
MRQRSGVRCSVVQHWCQDEQSTTASASPHHTYIGILQHASIGSKILYGYNDSDVLCQTGAVVTDRVVPNAINAAGVNRRLFVV